MQKAFPLNELIWGFCSTLCTLSSWSSTDLFLNQASRASLIQKKVSLMTLVVCGTPPPPPPQCRLTVKRLTITINFILQLGRSAGHHCRSTGPQQNRIWRVGSVGGLVLGEDSRFQPHPVDAADGEDLGVHGIPHAACHLHPDQEAHLLSGEEQSEISPHATSFQLQELHRQRRWAEWVHCDPCKWTETHTLLSKC